MLSWKIRNIRSGTGLNREQNVDGVTSCGCLTQLFRLPNDDRTSITPDGFIQKSI